MKVSNTRSPTEEPVKRSKASAAAKKKTYRQRTMQEVKKSLHYAGTCVTERSHPMKTIEEYMKLPYKMEIVPDDEDGYVVSFPELPGCLSTGDKIEETIKNAVDAKRAWISGQHNEDLKNYGYEDWSNEKL